MTRDRLPELRLKAPPNPQEDVRRESVRRESVTDGVSTMYTTANGSVIIHMEMQRSHKMNQLFEEVDVLRNLMAELKTGVKTVKTLHDDILSTPTIHQTKTLDLDEVMATIKQCSKVFRTKLNEIEKAIQKEEMEDESNENPASLRTRRAQHSALLREFVEIMNDYQQAQVNYRDRYKSRIKRQLSITETRLTDDQVDEMIEDGNFSIFTQGIIAESDQARNILADVEARHTDLLKLEKSLRDLHELFFEMATLVESQGEIVNRIETQVLATRDYTETAREQLKQAQVLQSSARRKMIWIIIIVIVILIIVGLIIYLSVR